MVLSDSDVHSFLKITNVSHSCGRNLDLLDFVSRAGRIGPIAPAGMQTVSTFILREFDQRHGDGSHRDFRLDAVDLSCETPRTKEWLVNCPRRSRFHQPISRSAQTPTWSDGHRSGLSLAGWLKHKPDALRLIDGEIQM